MERSGEGEDGDIHEDEYIEKSEKWKIIPLE
jgi:hypothetical protein